jgi:hypothetical protein
MCFANLSTAIPSTLRPKQNGFNVVNWRCLLPALVVVAGLSGINPRSDITAMLVAGENLPNAGTGQRETFELDIEPILTARGCNSGPCHGKSGGQNGFALSLFGFDPNFDFEAIVRAGRGRRVSPATPDYSLLLLKGTAEVPHGGGRKLERGSEDFQTLVRWIENGFPRSTAEDRKLEQISFEPPPHAMSPENQESLRVIAHYNDGSTRDVTTNCSFQSNEPAIVSVQHDGTLRSSKFPGEATIMARYMGRIATWNTSIPRPNPISAEQYAALPVNNFIDTAVWNKLKQLNILPSPAVGDATFLRRAYLDVIGRLPTATEAETFLSDVNSNKRTILIDTLLERPEYADFWANKWADLLRPNPYRVGIKATMSLDHWLRDVFRQNLPHDEFARRLITARGSTWRNGAVTVFRDRRSPDEVVTMMSQLFLGVRLDCAKCHQHPFEVYSQKDFYSLAAYFSRVGYKGTGLSPPISGGEEIVTLSQRGEVKHPRTGEVLSPAPLYGSAEAIGEEEDPREAFVRWLTAPDNHYFHRVAVNRVWADLFGIGIVDPVDDLRATNPPSNPELLEALANQFRQDGLDQKKLLRWIMTSHVYSLSSLPNETNASDVRNFSRHYRQRLRAEVAADAIVDITEVPTHYEGMPEDSRAMAMWTHRSDSDFLDAFSRPDPNQDPPCERMAEATVVQALHLMNSNRLQEKLSHESGRAARLAATDQAPDVLIKHIYLTIYNRLPTAEETMTILPEFSVAERSRRQVIEDLMWSLINTPEFIYKD